ncbi:putative UDP-glucosyltransferase 74F2 [Hibiscus syriacus]|uniref:UDP-glucosyltransferase 74F2 n=1 Tax=Hibiscus syriacus TaxID=106335 RepID=A0A6A2X7U5_HIBSY|nr:putative UDP-glucosyltransferase 74F2 [Hibiscus syriacus]
MEIKANGSVKLEPVFDDLGADSVMEKSIDDYLGRLEAVVTLRLPQIMARLGMSKSENAASCLVYDSVLPWALDIAKQQGVYGAEFFTFSCAVSSIYYNLHQGLLKVPIVEACLSMAGLPLLRPHDFPSLVSDIKAYPTLTDLFTNQFSSFKKADWVFFNTFTSLENELGGPRRGSNGGVSNGLKRSGRNLLWVVRVSEQRKIPANFMEETSEKGLVVSWSPQLEVLSHKSVGCFMSHCGWNSTMEALSLGVPMVALPQWSDQMTNAKFIVGCTASGDQSRG